MNRIQELQELLDAEVPGWTAITAKGESVQEIGRRTFMTTDSVFAAERQLGGRDGRATQSSSTPDLLVESCRTYDRERAARKPQKIAAKVIDGITVTEQVPVYKRDGDGNAVQLVPNDLDIDAFRASKNIKPRS